jgi:hypothetical protein
MRRPSSHFPPARIYVPAAFTLALACAPPNRAATTTASLRGTASAAGDEWVERDIELERAVTLIAKPGLWPLEMDAAEDLLAQLAPVRREQPDGDQVALVGGPSGMLTRFNVSYSRDDEARWAFNSADFYFAEPDMAHLQQNLESLLVQQLGYPDWTDRSNGAEFSSARWSFGSVMRLEFSPATDGGEPSMWIAISGLGPDND